MTLGIIAEYNPFHLGHQYHIKEAKKISNTDTTVIAMSGNFTQRGEPAIIDKYYRTKMALSQGADLVLELPTTFSLAASGYFSQGGVLTLAACGVDALAFGSESCDLVKLQQIASLLAKEPYDYQLILKEYLKQGVSYPKAQALALGEYLQDSSFCFDAPNDSLAIGYLTTTEKYNLPITPLAILRKGAGHDQDSVGEEAFRSASSIRKMLITNTDASPFMPAECHQILQEAFAKGTSPRTLDDFSATIFTLLYHQNSESLTTLPDVNDDLARRILNQLPKCADIDTLLQGIKSKNHTLTRLRRILCYLLLNIKKEDMIQEPLYIRVLGFNEQGRKHLHTIKKSSPIPIITNAAQAKKILSADAYRQFSIDLRSAAVYETIKKPSNSHIQKEFSHFPICFNEK